jgi:hypothetical protein
VSDEVRRHDLIGDGCVTAVAELLEVTPHKCLVLS